MLREDYREPLRLAQGDSKRSESAQHAEFMRESDILVLPTIEEGSALVTSEARGGGCVLLVSDAAGAICKHMDNALVHRGDIKTLAHYTAMLHEDRAVLGRLRDASLRTTQEITWTAAGVRLLRAFRETVAAQSGRQL